MALSDRSINDLIMKGNLSIVPFVDKCPNGVISYGLSGAGYDIRLDKKFSRYDRNGTAVTIPTATGINQFLIDPKNIDMKIVNSFEVTDYYDMPPNDFVLAESLEYVRMPRDVIAICLNKSTYARCGVIVHPTVIENGWEGKITLEISNTSKLWNRIYVNEGILQLIFLKVDGECGVSYADKNGKYQYQKGLTLPIVR